jgi:hypothetical protein
VNAGLAADADALYGQHLMHDLVELIRVSPELCPQIKALSRKFWAQWQTALDAEGFSLQRCDYVEKIWNYLPLEGELLDPFSGGKLYLGVVLDAEPFESAQPWNLVVELTYQSKYAPSICHKDAPIFRATFQGPGVLLDFCRQFAAECSQVLSA